MRLAAEQLRQQKAAKAAALDCRPHVELDHLEVRRIEPHLLLLRGERPRDVLGPPLAVGARVAVAEADEVPVLAGDQEDEPVAAGVAGKLLLRPLVGDGADAERRPMELPELVPQRERIDLVDDGGQERSASRSTTTCVSGSANRSRDRSITPRSSHCERPFGWVDTMSSSGRNVRSASSIA